MIGVFIGTQASSVPQSSQLILKSGRPKSACPAAEEERKERDTRTRNVTIVQVNASSQEKMFFFTPGRAECFAKLREKDSMN